MSTSPRPVLLAASAAAVSLCLGCSGADDQGLPAPLDPLAIPEGCNPVAHQLDCLLPYPSDVFLTPDGAFPSGARVAIPEAARLTTDGGTPVDPTLLHPADGFSNLPQIVALLGAAIDDEALPGASEPARSLDPGSPTAVVHARTGERVLHLAELDPRADDPSEQALNIRPLVRLEDETRYVVGIRDLVREDGSPIPVPEGFRRIRDGEAAGDPILEPLAARYEEEIFPALEEAGFARGDLQLAWDFTTQSYDHVTGDLLAIRDAIMGALSDAPPPVTITSESDEVGIPDIARRVTGTVQVPLFLEENEPMAPLLRGDDGRPEASGTAEAEFTILVPDSVMSADQPARFLQYGHGFFGGQDEIEEDAVTTFAARAGVVVGAVDWVGSASEDRGPVGAAAVTAPSEVLGFTDRLHQAMAHQLAFAYAARSALPAEAALQREGGDPLFDPDALYFWGNSQGHVLGGTYVALSPHIERAVLSVGGGSYPLMMMRARPFIEFLDLLETQSESPLHLQKFISLTATTFDRIGPITYAPHVTGDPLPGAPAERRVLMLVGIGDTQVANIASHTHARSLGIPLLTPAPRAVPGLGEVAAPHDGSAVVEFDFGLEPPLPGTYAEPAEEANEVHGRVRQLEAAMLQADAFLEPGAPIEHFCDGPCTAP